MERASGHYVELACHCVSLASNDHRYPASKNKQLGYGVVWNALTTVDWILEHVLRCRDFVREH